MTDERSPESALRGRLADIFVPALVDGSPGSLEALSRRLGDRATVDDPRHGRAQSTDDIGSLLRLVAGEIAGARYEHRATTTGGDRDAAEGFLVTTGNDGARRESPIAIVAERRRLREIEIRIYHAYTDPDGGEVPSSASGTVGRAPSIVPGVASDRAATSALPMAPIAPLVGDVVEALRAGAADALVTRLERAARLVDPSGQVHDHQSGQLAAYLRDAGALDLEVVGVADDGRTACVEANLRRLGGTSVPALLAATRGDSGLVSELRLYWA